MPSGEIERYTSLAQVTHWAAAVLMLAVVVLAWVFMAMPAEQAGRFAYITLHKSIGQTIFFLTLSRLIWRRFHPAPPMSGRLMAWEALVARTNHCLLYAIMMLMPLTGYVLATAAARPSPYFWLFYWPEPAVSRVVAHAALQAHLAGQYLVYAMVGLHVAAVVWHVAVRRDGTLARMLPVQGQPATGSAGCSRPLPYTTTKPLP
jgi:cytochrome b561